MGIQIDSELRAQASKGQPLTLDQAMPVVDEMARGYGLKHCPTIFTKVPADIMYEYGAYGLPGRFSHWTHGRGYEQIKTQYDYGLSKIYELVINTDPAQAFLLETNTDTANIMVAAHVLGHVDFFQQNRHFGHTNRRMGETVERNAERLRKYEFDHGELKVEKVLDAALAIQLNIDQDPGGFRRPSKEDYLEECRKRAVAELKKREYPGSEYDDVLDLGKKKDDGPKPQPKLMVPFEPDPDLLWTVAEFSPILSSWQRDALHILRAEQQYFLPQMQTKIMNEGWASFWHNRIMRQLGDEGLLTDGQWVEYSQMHTSVLSPSRRSLNPYYVGFKIWEDLDAKHKGTYEPGNKPDRDRFGDVINPASLAGRLSNDIFFIRETMEDQGFLRAHLTPNLVEELDLFQYRKEGDRWVIVERDPEVIRQGLVESMTNFGQPVIKVEQGGVNYTGDGQLNLVHQATDGRPLDDAYAKRVLNYLYYLWGRPVNIKTVRDGKDITLSTKEGKTVLDPG